MKKSILSILMAIVAMVAMTSCGGDNNGAATGSGNELKPASEAISGDFGQYFQIVDKGYSLDGNELKVEIKRIKEGLPAPWKQSVKLEDIDLNLKLKIKDNDGNNIGDSEISYSNDKRALGSLIGLEVGQSASITFKGINKEAADGGVFAIKAIFKVNRYVIDLQGSIGSNLNLTMSLVVDNKGHFKGAYHYNRYSPDHLLYLMGTLHENGRVEMYEYTGDGTCTGDYNMTYKDGKMTGSMTNSRFNTYSVNLHDAKSDFDVTTLSFYMLPE